MLGLEWGLASAVKSMWLNKDILFELASSEGPPKLIVPQFSGLCFPDRKLEPGSENQCRWENGRMCHSVIMVQFVKAQNDDSGFPTASNAQGD